VLPIGLTKEGLMELRKIKKLLKENGSAKSKKKEDIEIEF